MSMCRVPSGTMVCRINLVWLSVSRRLFPTAKGRCTESTMIRHRHMLVTSHHRSAVITLSPDWCFPDPLAQPDAQYFPAVSSVWDIPRRKKKSNQSPNISKISAINGNRSRKLEIRSRSKNGIRAKPKTAKEQFKPKNLTS